MLFVCWSRGGVQDSYNTDDMATDFTTQFNGLGITVNQNVCYVLLATC